MAALYTTFRQRWHQPAQIALRYSLPDPHRAASLTLTFAALDQRVQRALGWLSSQGLQPGDVLALQMARHSTFLELHLAALAGGIITLPLNPDYTPAEVEVLLRDARPRLALLHPDPVALEADLRAAPPQPPRDDLSPSTTAVISYTSGTTGRPKGAVISHANILGTLEGLHAAWQWSAQDVLLHVLPLFHIHGLFVAQHGALFAGATTRWMDRFDPLDALRCIADEGISLFMGVPTHYSRFLSLPPSATRALDLSGVRLWTSGSAPLPARIHGAFAERFGHSILERYGMTEVGIVLSNPLDPARRRPGGVGFPLPGVEVRICDPEGNALPDGEVGELRIRGPGVIRAYLNQPEATAATLVDGWLRSGDLGLRDPADGAIRLVGRARDLIISGGLNVYPAEVEGVLLEHPAVQEAAVVGLPDPDWGERVEAAVVLSMPASTEALLEHCAQRLARYKRPKRLHVRPALPRNALGKVIKTALIANLSDD